MTSEIAPNQIDWELVVMTAKELRPTMKPGTPFHTLVDFAFAKLYQGTVYELARSQYDG